MKRKTRAGVKNLWPSSRSSCEVITCLRRTAAEGWSARTAAEPRDEEPVAVGAWLEPHEGSLAVGSHPSRQIVRRELRMRGEERREDPFVLLGLDGARGVDEAAARANPRSERFDELTLPLGVACDVRRPDSPTDVRVAGEGAEPAARRVQQDGVEEITEGRAASVGRQQSNAFRSPAPDQLLQVPQAPSRELGGDDPRCGGSQILEKQAMQSPVGANGLIFNPSLMGGATIHPSPNIKGAFTRVSHCNRGLSFFTARSRATTTSP